MLQQSSSSQYVRNLFLPPDKHDVHSVADFLFFHLPYHAGSYLYSLSNPGSLGSLCKFINATLGDEDTGEVLIHVRSHLCTDNRHYTSKDFNLSVYIANEFHESSKFIKFIDRLRLNETHACLELLLNLDKLRLKRISRRGSRC